MTLVHKDHLNLQPGKLCNYIKYIKDSGIHAIMVCDFVKY